MSKGYVYVLSNPSMPGLVKVGHSKHGGFTRAKQIFKTGTPRPFVLEFELFCHNAAATEAEVHEQLREFREHDDREFFRVSVPKAIHAVMEEAAGDIGHHVVCSDDYYAAIELGTLASQYGLSHSEVLAALPYLSEFALRAAIDEQSRRELERTQRLAAKGYGDF